MKSQLKRKGSRSVFKRRAAQLQAGLPIITARVTQEGIRHAQRGAFLNIYGTTPGAYERTSKLFGQIYGYGQAAGASIRVELGSNAPYSSFVEYGTGSARITPHQMEAMLETLPPGNLLRLGRSGQNYMVPGPFIGPALWLVRHRAHWEVQYLMRRLWA